MRTSSNNLHGADVEDISLGVQVGRPVIEFAAGEALDVIWNVFNRDKKERNKFIYLLFESMYTLYINI